MHGANMLKNVLKSKKFPFFQNEDSEPNSDMKEKCLGFISLGKNVTGEKEKAHWFSVMTAPRKVFTSSFRLE